MLNLNLLLSSLLPLLPCLSACSLYPLLREVQLGIDPLEVFADADWALLIGAKPRGPGMERKCVLGLPSAALCVPACGCLPAAPWMVQGTDVLALLPLPSCPAPPPPPPRRDLLDLNGQIFQDQARALNQVASRDCKMLVVGNPCNTNALIGMANAPDLPRRNWHALTRLDENRAKVRRGECVGGGGSGAVGVGVRSALTCLRCCRQADRQPACDVMIVLPSAPQLCLMPACFCASPSTCPLLQCQLALKAGKFYTSVTNMCVWGNHSTTQVPDFVNAKIGGRRAPAVIKDDAWLKDEFTPTVRAGGGGGGWVVGGWMDGGWGGAGGMGWWVSMGMGAELSGG